MMKSSSSYDTRERGKNLFLIGDLPNFSSVDWLESVSSSSPSAKGSSGLCRLAVIFWVLALQIFFLRFYVTRAHANPVRRLDCFWMIHIHMFARTQHTTTPNIDIVRWSFAVRNFHFVLHPVCYRYQKLMRRPKLSNLRAFPGATDPFRFVLSRKACGCEPNESFINCRGRSFFSIVGGHGDGRLNNIEPESAWSRRGLGRYKALLPFVIRLRDPNVPVEDQMKTNEKFRSCIIHELVRKMEIDRHTTTPIKPQSMRPRHWIEAPALRLDSLITPNNWMFVFSPFDVHVRVEKLEHDPHRHRIVCAVATLILELRQ